MVHLRPKHEILCIGMRVEMYQTQGSELPSQDSQNRKWNSMVAANANRYYATCHKRCQEAFDRLDACFQVTWKKWSVAVVRTGEIFVNVESVDGISASNQPRRLSYGRRAQTRSRAKTATEVKRYSHNSEIYQFGSRNLWEPCKRRNTQETRCGFARRR